MNEAGAELGFALGIALLGSLGTAIYRAQIPGHLPAGVPAKAAKAARDNLAAAARDLSPASTALPCWPPPATPSPAGCTSRAWCPCTLAA